jgi:tetratricopeptide (TPR) repeat protein
LSQQELVELLSPGDPQGNIAALTQLLRPHLMQRGVLLDFFHSQFRAAVEAAYLPTPTSRLAVHRRLADYFEARELNLRRLEELPWQLKTAGERDRLIRCLSEPDVFLALYTAEFQYELLHYWNWLGSGADPAGVYGRAVAQFRKIAPTPSRFCAFTHQVARFLAWMGLSGAAEEHYRAALGLAEAIYGPNAAMTGAVQNNLAELLTGTGRTDEAGSLYQSSLQAAESNPDAPKVLGIALSNLGHWYHANGRFPEAEPLIRRALSIHEELKGPDCQEATVDRLNLAEVLVKCQRFEEAERCCRRALDSFLARHGSAHPETARCQQCLGLILQYTGRRAEAQRVYLEALATYEAAGIADWPEAVAVRNNVSWLLMEDSRTPRHVSPQAASHELDLRTDVE